MEVRMLGDDIPHFNREIYSRSSIWTMFNAYLNSILGNKATRKVFWFLCLNLTFTFIEFTYGAISNSLGLTADAIHMLFDSTAIICSLIASVVASWQPSPTWTFGFHRVEAMTGFLNALALIFASAHIVWEAMGRLWDPVELKADKLLLVSILGLLVNMGKFLWSN